MFVHGVRQFSADLRFLEPAPLPCKFPSVSTPGFAESTCVSRPCLSCCRLSSCRVVELVRPPTAFPRTAPRVPWVSFLDPRGCQSPDDPVTKSQPLCVLVGVVTSCVLCARVRCRVSRSCATENTYRHLNSEVLQCRSVILNGSFWCLVENQQKTKRKTYKQLSMALFPTTSGKSHILRTLPQPQSRQTKQLTAKAPSQLDVRGFPNVYPACLAWTDKQRRFIA